MGSILSLALGACGGAGENKASQSAKAAAKGLEERRTIVVRDGPRVLAVLSGTPVGVEYGRARAQARGPR
jgi:hypothetical protein